MQLAELANVLIAAGKNVLILDTCTLLDVIRSPFRDTMPVVEYAVRMEAELRTGTLPFSLALPSLFSREWTDNVSAVREELQKELNLHRMQSDSLSRLHQFLHGNPLPIPDVTTYSFAEGLEALCNEIIARAHVIEEQEQCVVKAARRVVEARAPAQKGKQSYKDCQIFEETLAAGQELRMQGFAGKIVFASSNRTDYGRTGNPLPTIEADLSGIGVEFAGSLNYAYHLSSSQTVFAL